MTGWMQNCNTSVSNSITATTQNSLWRKAARPSMQTCWISRYIPHTMPR